jgi:hypothetical protein
MMYSNDMDAAGYQQKMQTQQLASNAGQQAITNETQGRVAMEGAQRVAGLSAAQMANQQKSGHVAMAIMAAKGGDSMMKQMADPNVVAGIGRSLGEQSRLRAMMA